MQGRVAARKVRVVVEAAARAGVSRDAVLDGLGLADGALDDPEAWVPARVWHDVWVRVVALTGQPALGLYAAQGIDPGYFGVIEYAAGACGTVGEAIPTAARYFRLANTWGRVDVTREAGVVRVARHILGGDELPPQAAEFALVAMVRVFRRVAARPVPIARVTFRHAAPADAAPHRAFFQCPVVFGAREDAVEVPLAATDIPMRAPDPLLRARIEAHGEALLGVLDDAGAPAAVVVRHELARRLHAGLPTLDAVARRLGQSRRSLQRRLQDEGTSYREVCESLLRGLAERYLRAEMAPGEVAFLLGYSEVSAFHRAFRGWTGMTPGAFARVGASGAETGAIGQ